MSQTNNVTTRPGQYVQANGLNIYYEELGSGKPLILLHGALGTGATQWQTLLPILSPHFRVILPDARGHGRTIAPPGEIRLPALTDDVAAFINSLNLEKPLLCGWSTGGDTAVQLGIRYPNLVSAMVVGGVTHRASKAYFDSLAALGVEGPGLVNTRQTEKAIPQLVTLLRSVHAQGPDHWVTLLVQLSYDMIEPTLPSSDELRSIEASTLVIWGDRDQYLPVENAVELYRLIPNAELAVIPCADHSVVRTNPELFADLVKAFLLRHTTLDKVDNDLAV